MDDRELKATIIHKIFEANSSLHVKRHATGKVQELISVFQETFISTYKIFISGGGMSTRQLIYEVLRFS